MPKLKDRDVERNQLKIEGAALRVFTRQGFHGTSIREIADEAHVSVGNIYNYYSTKDELFRRLVVRYGKQMAELQRRILTPLLGSDDPATLRELAQAVRQIVYDNPDYWRLMYIDVVEFGNRHFRHSFRDLARKLEALAGGYGRNGNGRMAERGLDPSLAFTAIYLQFFTYFLVEKLFGGKQHLGVADDRAIDQLVQIFTKGVGSGSETGHNGNSSWAPSPAPAGKPGAARRNQP